MTDAIEMIESRSVGYRPVGTMRSWPCRSATPHDRQTWAHSGFARPQLKQSTVSSVTGWGSLLGRGRWRESLAR